MEIMKGNYKTTVLSEEINGLRIGGEGIMPFYLFEGTMPNPPRLALEVFDEPPTDWAATCLAPYQDVINDPLLWAKRCQDYGAEIICLRLISADPVGTNKSIDKVVPVVKKIIEGINLPLIIYGCGKVEKDAELLKEVAAACQGEKILLGPVVEGNYKTIGATSIAYQQNISAQAPMDLNLTKQLNILLGNLGVRDEMIVIDPTSSTLGYGLEYSFSIIERIRYTALLLGDEKIRMPILADIGKECWKVKEVKEDLTGVGDLKQRGIIWEAITGLSLILAGANILVIRHPEVLKLIKELNCELMGIEEPDVGVTLAPTLFSSQKGEKTEDVKPLVEVEKPAQVAELSVEKPPLKNEIPVVTEEILSLTGMDEDVITELTSILKALKDVLSRHTRTVINITMGKDVNIFLDDQKIRNLQTKMRFLKEDLEVDL